MLDAASMSHPRRTWTVAALTCALGLALGLAPSPSRAAPPGGPTERPSALATTKLEGDQYLIEIEPPELRVGTPGALRVSIEGKAGFHFNRDFPTKLELGTAPDGLDFPKPVLKRADGALDEAGKTFTFKAPMTAKRAGEFALETTLKFSVCNEDKCVVQRQTLRTKVEAR
jgi:hypothetical protein